MKINTEILEDHQAKLTVTIEDDAFRSAKRRAAKQLSQKYKIPGFRPGKAPYGVVEKHLGEGAIAEQAIGILVDEVYPQALESEKIASYGPGSLEEMPSIEPPSFIFLVPLAPEVNLPDYRSLRIEYDPKSVTPEDVDNIINNLRESQATITNVDRLIQEGDMVYIVLSGERKGEEDPEKKILLEERRYPVIVEKENADQESEYPFPGFSRKLIGMKAGDDKSYQHKFSKTYEFEDLQGVTGIYKVKVEEVKGRSLPDVTDEFAKSVGEYQTVDELRQEIERTLSEQYTSEQMSEYEDSIVNSLIEQSTFKYPPQMLEDEIDDFIHDLEHQLSHQGITIDIYLKSRGIEMEALREEVKENAIKRMKRSLLIMNVANEEKITIPSEEIEERVQRTLQEVSNFYSEEEAKKLGSGKNLENLRSRIASDEIINRTFKLLVNIAMGKNTGSEIDHEGDDSPEVVSESPKAVVLEESVGVESQESSTPQEETTEANKDD